MVTKSELVFGYRKLKDEVELSRTDWGNNQFDVLEETLKGSINRAYGNGFLGIPDTEVMRPEVESTYKALLKYKADSCPDRL